MSREHGSEPNDAVALSCDSTVELCTGIYEESTLVKQKAAQPWREWKST
jgi:hypothetical protein